MTDREKLKAVVEDWSYKDKEKCVSDSLVDHLIANGVTIIESPKTKKMLCIQWNPGHHGLNQRCEWKGKYTPCSCDGDYEKCMYHS